MSIIIGINSLKDLALRAYVFDHPSALPTITQTRVTPSSFAAVKLLQLWDKLKSNPFHGPINISKHVIGVENQYRIANGGFQEGSTSDLATDLEYCRAVKKINLPVETKINLLFLQLTNSLKGECSELEVKTLICEEDFKNLQRALLTKYENEALEKIWSQRLIERFNLAGLPGPNGHEEIRAWLRNPENLGQLLLIRSLELDNLSLKAVPPEIGLFSHLVELLLSKNQLTSLPDSIGDLHALRDLQVDDNQLASLPDSIGSLQALINLKIDKNKITTLPDSIGNLRALTDLQVADNQLTHLPVSIGLLQALVYLEVDKNHLTSLPESIGNLQALTNLRGNNNQLAALPESIGNLHALTELSFDKNFMTSLPESIGNLQLLTELCFDKNRLTTLPESICNLQDLEFPSFNENPLMFTDNHSGNIDINREFISEVFQNVRNYQPKTIFGNLYKQLFDRSKPENIISAFRSWRPHANITDPMIITRVDNLACNLRLKVLAESAATLNVSDMNALKQNHPYTYMLELADRVEAPSVSQSQLIREKRDRSEDVVNEDQKRTRED